MEVTTISEIFLLHSGKKKKCESMEKNHIGSHSSESQSLKH